MYLNDKLESFLKYLSRNMGYSDTTIITYEIPLREMLEVAEIEEIAKDKFFINLMPYRMKIASNNKRTISKKLSAIRSFTKYLMDIREIEVTLKADSSVKVQKTLPKPIDSEKIKEAIKKANLFEKSLIYVFYGLGLRISEVANLKNADIDREWVRVLGKGSKHRDVPLLPEVRDILESYHKEHPTKTWVFEKDSKQMSVDSLRYMVNKVFKNIGLKVTPHQLRHSFATDLLNNGARILEVKEMLGHSNVATTEIYTKLSSAKKMDSYMKSHPLMKERF